MKRIWKYPLTEPDLIFAVPENAEILTVQMQNDVPYEVPECNPFDVALGQV